MILLAPDGRGEHVWQGAFAGKQRAAIEPWFGVQLP